MDNALGKSDYWWLSSSQRSKYQQTEFGHHRPIRDDEDPSSIKWDNNVCSISELEHWRDRFHNTNVYRTLKITSISSGVDEIIGPFLIDIDNGDEKLEDTLTVARKTFLILHDVFKVETDSLRVFFTGHKGFNFEICPQALDIKGAIDDQVRKSAQVLYQITEKLRGRKSWQIRNQVSDIGTVVDQIYGNRLGYKLKHPYIRLHNSLNIWISSDDKTKSRMKIELTVEELNKLSATEIVSRSEKLVN